MQLVLAGFALKIGINEGANGQVCPPIYMIKKDKNPKIAEEQKRDHALYFVADGEPGFSEAHNRAVIAGTIKKYEAKRKLKMKEYRDQIAERSDAVATYLTSRIAEGNTPIEKYFGKKMMSHLRGEKILQILKGFYTIGGKKRKLYLPN